MDMNSVQCNSVHSETTPSTSSSHSFCVTAGTRPIDQTVSLQGDMRRVVEVDGNGNKVVKWIGAQSFVKDMMPPSRRVLGFRTPHGYMNTSGRYIR